MSCRCWRASGLAGGVTGFANPKSSTGRLDVLTRLITDRGTAFDQIERGYAGAALSRGGAADLQRRRAPRLAAQPVALPARQSRSSPPASSSASMTTGQLVRCDEPRPQHPGQSRAGDDRSEGRGSRQRHRLSRQEAHRQDRYRRIGAYDPHRLSGSRITYHRNADADPRPRRILHPGDRARRYGVPPTCRRNGAVLHPLRRIPRPLRRLLRSRLWLGQIRPAAAAPCWRYARTRCPSCSSTARPWLGCVTSAWPAIPIASTAPASNRTTKIRAWRWRSTSGHSPLGVLLPMIAEPEENALLFGKPIG